MNQPVMAVVLAAGKGTRMQSDLPKVLVPACGRPLVDYVMDVLEQAGVQRVVVVVGYQAEHVKEVLKDRPGVEFAEQVEQLGTGHAVMMCRDQLETHEGPVLVLTGDSPMVQLASLRALIEANQQQPTSCLLGTLNKEDPSGLGRIVRDDQGQFVGIVEQKDATDAQRQINEVNMSTYLFDCGDLLWSLDRLTTDNRQQEYYLTDCPGILLAANKTVRALPVLQECEALSVNTIDDLAEVEAELQRQGHAAGG